MTPISRRRVLQLSVASLGAAVAGCIGEGNPGDSDTPSGSDGATGTGTDTRTDEQTTGTPRPSATELMDTETVQYDSGSTIPDWHEDDAVGHVVLADSEDRARAIVDTTELPEERQDAVADFVSQTDFDTSLLALVETVGPNTCYNAVEVTNLRLADDRLAGEATALDTSDGDVCGEAVTYAAALVRATFDGAPPDEATFTITDGWGNTADVTASVDDRLGPDPDDLTGHVRPADDPSIGRNPLACDDADFERHGSWVDDPPWGVATDDRGEETFALRIDALEAAYGETITVRMTNVSDAVQYTGNRNKYGFQTYTEEGWQDVRGAEDGGMLGYTDEAIGHRPGEGFEWTLELTEEGLVADHAHADSLQVCPDLEPGRYRFVFWEPAVAVAFDLEA